MSVVWRVRIFITVIVLAAALLPDPWPLVVGCVTYIAVVMPGIVTDWRSPWKRT